MMLCRLGRARMRASNLVLGAALGLLLSPGWSPVLHAEPLETAANKPAAVSTDSPIPADTLDRSDRLVRLATQLAQSTPAAPASEPKTPATPASPKLPAIPAPAATQPESTEKLPLPALSEAATPAATAPRPVSARESLPLGPASSTMPTPLGNSAATSANDTGWLLNTLAALGVTIGLMLVLRAFVLRSTGRAVSKVNSNAVEVLSRTTLAPRNQVMLLRVGQRVLVVSESTNGVQLLADINEPEEVAALLTTINAGRPGSQSNNFEQVFRSLSEQYQDEHQVAQDDGDDSEQSFDRTRDRVSGLLAKIRATSAGGRQA